MEFWICLTNPFNTKRHVERLKCYQIEDNVVVAKNPYNKRWYCYDIKVGYAISPSGCNTKDAAITCYQEMFKDRYLRWLSNNESKYERLQLELKELIKAAMAENGKEDI